MIKIQAYQNKGIRTEKCQDSFEFCCWHKLFEWMKQFAGLNKCPECKKELCCFCKEPVHIDKFGGICKMGVFCNKTKCLTELKFYQEKINKLKSFA